MSQDNLIDKIAAQARILGILFYRSAEHDDVSALIRYMQTRDWLAEWGGDPQTLDAIHHQLIQVSEESYDEAYQRLFIGPDALPAPPWGSVYTDEESVLFGESTLRLRQWMRQNDIAGMTEGKEPEDHFGLLMLLVAWAAEEKPQLLAELLGEHLLPWGYRFLTLMIDSAQHPFYAGISRLALVTLQSWQAALGIADAQIRLYR
ncbi:Tat proofreading chaperone DmsD [Entomohabitans teleogrylli]|uniref:Tat proofreading chaperone DmsD n=1 Tax=Entomohabitans teleogrylli TaxID=1384589 RepID=UPI00073D2047|nr:Tat proofreading chaperone DmsD [Entomohabitans teleogrylli]